MGEKRTITVEMEARSVPVPKEYLEVWRRGIARMYEELDEMIERDRKVKEISACSLNQERA